MNIIEKIKDQLRHKISAADRLKEEHEVVDNAQVPYNQGIDFGLALGLKRGISDMQHVLDTIELLERIMEEK